jgi:putative ABC transport system ATP-binding protein
VLEGIDLDVNEAEFVALMGPSGSGKSTLLNLIAGIDQPSGGTIEIGGVDIASWRGRTGRLARRARGLHLPVLQPDAGAERLRERGAAAAADRPVRARAPQHVEAGAGHGPPGRPHADHYPNELSGGQQQRVAIARALVTDPTLIVADEPTGDLDRTTGEEVLDLLDELHRELGKTIVMVTHDPKAAARAGRLVHLEKGVLVTTKWRPTRTGFQPGTCSC